MTFNSLHSFYRSKEWEEFRKSFLAERLARDGEIIDEVTKKPIINKYDVILHHKTHLNETNVFDYNISLNPDNIMVVSHRTHNNIHNRFGSYTKHIYIVWGSPCAGKTSFVLQRALKDDLIIDIDRLFEAVNTSRSNRVLSNVMDLHRFLIDMVKTRKGQWVNAWIIKGLPLTGERERLANELDAELIFIDTDKETCLERSKEKGQDYYKIVEDWWKKYCPPTS